MSSAGRRTLGREVRRTQQPRWLDYANGRAISPVADAAVRNTPPGATAAWRRSVSSARKNVTAIVVKARETLAARDELIQWKSGAGEELRCRIRWPDDPDGRATLTVLFVHLPKD
jgi:hypothetical protein